MSQMVRQQSAKLFKLVRFQYGTCVAGLMAMISDCGSDDKGSIPL